MESPLKYSNHKLLLIAVVYMFYHFYAASKYVMIKQLYLLGQMDQLIADLRNDKKRSKQNFPMLRRRFRKINEDLAYQCAEICGYNRFWSAILTAQFFPNMVIFCYLLYCFLFVDIILGQMIYFVFFLIEIGGLIFLVIFRCSLVDHHNDLFYAKNVKACILFELHFGEKISPRELTNVRIISAIKY